jgi:hypothetical protein
MIERSIRRLMAVVTIATVAGLYGCASSDEQMVADTATCHDSDQQNCEARDNARQARDADDYQNEPALGYLQSPPGMLPVPLTSRNTSSSN